MGQEKHHAKGKWKDKKKNIMGEASKDEEIRVLFTDGGNLIRKITGKDGKHKGGIREDSR